MDGTQVGDMKWASTASSEPALGGAIRESAAEMRAQLGGIEPDLLVLFVSQHHASNYEHVLELTAGELNAGLVIGCSAGGVIGGGREIEQHPGLSMTGAVLPDVTLKAFHVDGTELPRPEERPQAWEDLLGVAVATEPQFLLLADPFSFDSEAFLRGVDSSYPASKKIGGLASGGRQPGSNALFLGDRAHRSGLVGAAFSGNVQVDTIVAQGCRPIGQPMFVTKCAGNIVWQLDGQPAMQVLREVYEGLHPTEQELARHSLFLGIAMKEDRNEYRQGDFLIRNIVGTDTTRAGLAIGALLRENSVVQFHLRDAKTSAEDLEQLLTRYQREEPGAHPRGALLFSCLGRGMHLYGKPDHDTESFRRHLGAVPLGGFFCNGEIGPVHDTTFLHGYTSSFGLFKRRNK